MTTPTAKCTRCRRTLTSAASIARGKGRHCARLDRREAAARILTRPFRKAEAARTKALQLLADKALIPTQIAGQYLAVASDGIGTYLVDIVEQSCTCKGHQRVGRCYHLVAAQITEIATSPRSAHALAA